MLGISKSQVDNAIEAMNTENLTQDPGVPLNALPPISLDRFLEQTGISAATAWRWRRRRWLRTIVIANRHYLTREAIAEFVARAQSGEFAGVVPNPSARRLANPVPQQ